MIGPSGAGKTSFVRAGVVASRPSGWAAVVTTPGTSPLLMLGQALAPELQGDVEALRRLVRFEDPGEAFETLVRWRKAHAEALLVVDQFEELFTLCPPEAQSRFAALLGRLAGEAGVHVLLSMRDDFLMRCHEHEALAPVFAELTPLGPLAGEALRRALEEPAKAEGFRFEQGLVGKMTAAVEGERGALPLLAFAVSRLWEKRDRERKLLTQEAYAEIGGVAGALARHAEATLERIGAERQGMVREVFRNLVTSQGTRAACDREELLSVFPDRKAAEEVLGQLVAARLLTSWEMPIAEGAGEGVATAPAPGRHRIEIVHESLLRSWLRLVRWQAQDAEGSLLRDQLKQAAHLWDEKGRPADLLWSGTSFREYALWRERYPGKLTAVEEAFARAMTDRALRRRRLRRAAFAAALVGVSAVAIVVSVSRQQAVASQRRGEASRLVALGRLELETDPTLTLAYVRKSLEVHDSSEARRLALEALWRGPVARVLPVPKESDGCIFVAPSPDGQWLACSNWGGIITLFSADGKTTRVLPNNRNAARVRAVLFSDDSRRLATFAPGDPETVVWSVEGQEVARFQPGGHPRRFSGDELQLMLEPGPDRPEWQVVARRIGSPEARVLGFVGRGAVGPTSREPASSTRGGEGSSGVRSARRSRLAPTSRLASTISRWPASTSTTAPGGSSRSTSGARSASGTGRPTGGCARCRAWIPIASSLHHSSTPAGPSSRGNPCASALSLSGTSPGRRTPARCSCARARSPAKRVGRLPARRTMAGDRARVEGRPLAAAGAVASRHPGRTEPRGGVHAGLQAARLVRKPSNSHLPGHARRARGPSGRGGASITCYGLAMDPSGGHVLLAATTQALLLAPLDGGEAVPLVRVPPTESICAVALDAAGRWAATAAVYAPEVRDRLLHVVDRRTGEARAFPLPGAEGEHASSGGVAALAFASEGRLFSAGAAGLRRWDPQTGQNEVLHPSPCRPMAVSADGRRIVAGCKAGGLGPSAGAGVAEFPEPPFELLVIDTSTGQRRTIGTHGTDISSLALDPSGELLATGDSNGTVRVGRVDGSEPHLLVGAGGVVWSLAFSPDGRWIASTAGNDIRLWPMPDLSQPPLHTLPHDVLLAKLDSLTNVRVVEDPAASSGYKVEIGPFPGWKDVPEWWSASSCVRATPDCDARGRRREPASTGRATRRRARPGGLHVSARTSTWTRAVAAIMTTVPSWPRRQANGARARCRGGCGRRAARLCQQGYEIVVEHARATSMLWRSSQIARRSGSSRRCRTIQAVTSRWRSPSSVRASGRATQ